MSKITFQTVLNALTDTSSAFPARHLEHFSDMAPADLAALMQIWPDLPKNRKRSLLQKLVQRYDEDTLISYEALAAALLDDPDHEVRANALRLLAETGNTHLLPKLIKLTETDSVPEVQAYAAQALGSFVEMGELEEIPTETLRLVEEALLRAARSGHSDVQRAAIESLGFSSRSEVEVLIENAYEKHDPKWIATALFAMGRSANERWEEQILTNLDNSNLDIQRNAVQAAGELRLAEARQFLLTLLEEEEDDGIIAATIWSLSQIGGEDVRITIETLLDQTEDDELQDYLEEALSNLDFTEEMNAFDLLSLNPDVDLDDKQ